MRDPLFYTVLLISFLSAGCSGNKQKIDELNAKIDSLEIANDTYQSDLNDLNDFIVTLSDGLDSIAKLDNILFYTNKGREQTLIDRKQLKKNLDMFATTLQNQRLRISQLTDSLSKKGANISKLNNLIDFLNQQIDQKDAIIKSIRAELENSKVNIAQLNDKINDLSEDNEKLNSIVDKQTEVLSIQDEIINEGYVVMATKKELSQAGLISTGFLKKTKVDYNNLSKDKFTTIDIRTYTSITIPSSKSKVLSQMPASSYQLVKDGDNTILKITDPTSFWSITNYLIIQTN